MVFGIMLIVPVIAACFGVTTLQTNQSSATTKSNRGYHSGETIVSSKWTQQDIPDLTRKVIVITGANSGLGYECSKTFAKKGATVVMTARNLEKANRRSLIF